MSDEENKPDEKPDENAAPQVVPEPAEASAAKAAESPVAKVPEKPSETAGAPAAKPAEKPPEVPAPPPSPGVYGNMLKNKGIESTPLPLSAGVETMELAGPQLPAAIKLLRESPEAKLDFLVAVSGVDSADTYDSVYHLWSYHKLDELVVKVRTAKASVPADKLPEVPSISTYWTTADWHERETYDLVGIRYIGHRYLRRILNPWDWEGHPLRRDYKQPVDALNNKHPDSMR